MGGGAERWCVTVVVVGVSRCRGRSCCLQSLLTSRGDDDHDDDEYDGDGHDDDDDYVGSVLLIVIPLVLLSSWLSCRFSSDNKAVHSQTTP